MHLAAAQRGVNEISKRTRRFGGGESGGGSGGNSRSNPERELSVRRFSFLLFFHFSYFPVVLVALLLLLVYFLAPKPKNPNEAKRMSSVLG